MPSKVGEVFYEIIADSSAAQQQWTIHTKQVQQNATQMEQAIDSSVKQMLSKFGNFLAAQRSAMARTQRIFRAVRKSATDNAKALDDVNRIQDVADRNREAEKLARTQKIQGAIRTELRRRIKENNLAHLAEMTQLEQKRQRTEQIIALQRSEGRRRAASFNLQEVAQNQRAVELLEEKKRKTDQILGRLRQELVLRRQINAAQELANRMVDRGQLQGINLRRGFDPRGIDRANRSARRFSGAMQQLSFGIQDAVQGFSQFGMTATGFRFAVLGATNNMQQFLAISLASKAVWLALGAGIAAAVAPFVINKIIEKLNEAKEAAEEAAAAFERFGSALESSISSARTSVRRKQFGLDIEDFENLDDEQDKSLSIRQEKIKQLGELEFSIQERIKAIEQERVRKFAEAKTEAEKKAINAEAVLQTRAQEMRLKKIRERRAELEGLDTPLGRAKAGEELIERRGRTFGASETEARQRNLDRIKQLEEDIAGAKAESENKRIDAEKEAEKRAKNVRDIESQMLDMRLKGVDLERKQFRDRLDAIREELEENEALTEERKRQLQEIEDEFEKNLRERAQLTDILDQERFNVEARKSRIERLQEQSRGIRTPRIGTTSLEGLNKFFQDQLNKQGPDIQKAQLELMKRQEQKGLKIAQDSVRALAKELAALGGAVSN